MNGEDVLVGVVALTNRQEQEQEQVQIPPTGKVVYVVVPHSQVYDENSRPKKPESCVVI